MDMLKSLIIVSEKAANIARVIREDEYLFEMLVQKKEGKESNPRFVEDFKTLADVLIQEMVRHDIARQYPSLASRIKGEENNTFRNKLGKTVQLRMSDDKSKTSALLKEVLNGDSRAAELLAQEAHRALDLSDVNTTQFPEHNFNIDLDHCAIWIDPIDSTAEYINGTEKIFDTGVSISGLKCATVLIGVYNIETRKPMLGIINQPFATYKESRYNGSCIWGISLESYNIPWQIQNVALNHIICLSSSEDDDIKNKLRTKGFKLMEAAGVGYKILTVLEGSADAYIISKDSTYKWDTCGPHAVLKSLGGDILNFQEAIKGNIIPIEYSNKENQYCNKGGLLVYRNLEVLKYIIGCLNQ